MTTYHEKKKKSKQPVRHSILPGYAENTTINSRSSLFIIVCAYYTTYKCIKQQFKAEYKQICSYCQWTRIPKDAPVRNVSLLDTTWDFGASSPSCEKYSSPLH